MGSTYSCCLTVLVDIIGRLDWVCKVGPIAFAGTAALVGRQSLCLTDAGLQIIDSQAEACR